MSGDTIDRKRSVGDSRYEEVKITLYADLKIPDKTTEWHLVGRISNTI